MNGSSVNRRPYRRPIISIMLVAGITLAAFSASKGENSAAPDAPGVGSVKRADLVQRVTIAGTVAPRRKTIVMAPYTGYVKKLFVQIGQNVKLDDPIVSVSQSLQSREPVFPLRAPFPGKVVQVGKAEGERVKEGETKDFIVRIDDLSQLHVPANAPEIDQVKIRVGQEVVIKAAAILDRTYKGVIRELSFAANEKEQWGRTQVDFPVKMEILDPDARLSPGMSVVVDIITQKKEKVLLLRHEFLHQEGEKYFVMTKDGTRRDVKVGLQNEEAFEIVGGLKEGEQVKQVDFSTMKPEDES